MREVRLLNLSEYGQLVILAKKSCNTELWAGALAEGQTEWQIQASSKQRHSVLILQIRDDKNHLFSTKIQRE